jgi:hypothetical protein
VTEVPAKYSRRSVDEFVNETNYINIFSSFFCTKQENMLRSSTVRTRSTGRVTPVAHVTAIPAAAAEIHQHLADVENQTVQERAFKQLLLLRAKNGGELIHGDIQATIDEYHMLGFPQVTHANFKYRF